MNSNAANIRANVRLSSFICTCATKFGKFFLGMVPFSKTGILSFTEGNGLSRTTLLIACVYEHQVCTWQVHYI